jgi:hypothetical protein
MIWQAVVQQVLTQTAPAPTPPRFNPHPPGQIQAGSGTDAVLKFLAQAPDRWHTRSQIILRTGRSGKAIDWAISFLIQQQLIRAVQDATRNPRYRRFRIVKE